MRKNYKNIKKINDLDYKIFSQFGEDGIIDYLVQSLEITSPKFVEIGVGDYSECNTRFLFEIAQPKGLIIDCVNNFKNRVKKNISLWKGDLKVLNQKISSKNINQILDKEGFNSGIDIFSLDIDGVDYWILEKLPKNFSKIVNCYKQKTPSIIKEGFYSKIFSSLTPLSQFPNPSSSYSPLRTPHCQGNEEMQWHRECFLFRK